MKTLTRINTLLLATLLAPFAHAQSKNKVELTVATSTPATIDAAAEEDAKTRALISADRPLQQSLVDLEEKMIDAEIEKEQAQLKSDRFEKITQLLEDQKTQRRKQLEQLDAISELDALKQAAVTPEPSLSTTSIGETINPGEEQKLEIDQQTEASKQADVTALENELTALSAQIDTSEQAITDQADSHQTALEARLAEALDKKTALETESAKYENEVSATAEGVIKERLDKQLENTRLRAEKVDARIANIQQKLDELDKFKQDQAAALSQNVETIDISKSSNIK